MSNNGQQGAGLSVRGVEVEHLRISIIALHEESKVVEDEHKDAATKREKEAHHAKAAEEVSQFLSGTLQVQAREDEDKNSKLEEMLAKENSDLQDEIQEIMRQIDQVNRDKDEQKRKYDS